MFTPDFFIDAFQSTKQTVFNKIVTDKELQKVAGDYLAAQTQFAKMMVYNTITVAKYSVDSITKCWFPKEEEKVVAPYKVESPAEKATNTDTQGESNV